MGGNYEGGLTPQGFIQDFELGMKNRIVAG